jgi:predicted DNA binding protein
MIELHFIVPSERWIGNLYTNSSAKIKVLSMKLDDSKRNIIHFVDITSEKTSAEDLMKELESLYDVLGSEMSSLSTNRIVGAVTSNDCKVGMLIMSSKSKSKGGLFVGMATTENDSKMNYKLYIRGDKIPEFLQTLHEEGVSYKISEITKMISPNAITSKQSRLLKSALELGYYDHPKRISAEELTKTLGLMAGVVSETLRMAENKIIKRSGTSDSGVSNRVRTKVSTRHARRMRIQRLHRLESLL